MSVPTETRDDAQLLRASRDDVDAFAELYDRYAERLLDYFTRRASSEDTALELCAETLSRAWVTRERFEDQHKGSAAPWLYGIARNVLLMSIRRGAVERATAKRLGELDYEEVADALGTTESAARVRVHRGLAALRKRLSGSKEDPR